MILARAIASGLAAIVMFATTSAFAAGENAADALQTVHNILLPRESRANLRRVLTRDHDTSPEGVTRRLRTATVLAEWWPLEELPTITKAVADIDLAATLPQSFNLLAALGRTKSLRVLPLLVRGLAVDLFKNCGLFKSCDDQIDLGDGGVIDRMQALEIVFAPFGADVCKLLPPLLGKADNHTAVMASVVLGRSRCREARPLLHKWTELPDRMASSYALAGLGDVADIGDRPLFMECSLKSMLDYRKFRGAQGLAQIGDVASVTRLIELVGDRDSYVGNVALETVFRAPSPRALADLILQRQNEALAADIDELLAALAQEAGVPAAALQAGTQKTIDDAVAQIASRRATDRQKAAQALPGSGDIAKILAARGAILARHDANWIAQVRPWDDALVHATRKRAGLPEAYASTDEMVDLLERRCHAGGARSCLRAARIIELQTRLDGPRAIAMAHKGCELGLEAACFDEPGFYETGRGVRKDIARATRMFEALCNKNLSRACVNLGMYKWRGLDGKPDAKGAYDLCFSAAPDARWADWCNQAGRFAVEGSPDAPPDPKTAARLYRRACQLRLAKTCPLADQVEGKP